MKPDNRILGLFLFSSFQFRLCILGKQKGQKPAKRTKRIFLLFCSSCPYRFPESQISNLKFAGPNRFCGCDNRRHYPEGIREGSQGLERSVNPWECQINKRILKGCEIPFGRFLMFSHPFRMRIFFCMLPGVYASLQPLATFSNPLRGRSHKIR
jgi:hypothetical protein